MENLVLLERLKKTLKLEITYPPILLGVTFLLMNSTELPIVAVLIIVIAKLAIPFIIYVLYKIKKFGWITSLILMIAIPSAGIYWFIKDSMFGRFFLLIPFILFYFYCLLLKFSVDEWITESEASLEYKQKKTKRIEQRSGDLILSVSSQSLYCPYN